VDLLGPRGLRGPGRRTPAGSSRDVPAGRWSRPRGLRQRRRLRPGWV